jgi:hypothetical protein
MRSDPVMEAIRELRPEGAEGWAGSTEGQAVLRDVLGRAERRAVVRRPSRAVVAGGALFALLVGGGAVAAAGGMPWGDKGQGLMCARTLSAQADLSELPPKATKDFDARHPGTGCAAGWKSMWQGLQSTPVPTSFAACYHPNAQGDATDPGSGGRGGPVIYPAEGLSPAAACARIGAETGP